MIGQQDAPLGLQDFGTLVDQKPSYSDTQGGEGALGAILTSLSQAHAVAQGTGLASAFVGQYTSVPRGMFDAFVNTCQRWCLEPGAQLKLLGYPEHDFLGSQLLMGHVPARTHDVRDRIGYVLAISLGLGTIFNEAVAPELAWLSTTHPKLME